MSIHIFGRIYNPNATEMYWMYWLLDVIGVFPRKKCDRSEPTNSYICGTQVRSKNSLAIATGGWCLWTHDVPELHPSPGKGESWSFLGIIEKGLGNWKLWYNIMLGGTRSLWLHDAFTAYYIDEMSQKSDNWCRTRAFMVGGGWRVCWKEIGLVSMCFFL